MADLVGHFLVFGLLAIGFLMVPLIVGRFVRPSLPTPEKDAIYECGEPAIGSSYIQFDLRFYVVALLCIIFDVKALPRSAQVLMSACFSMACSSAIPSTTATQCEVNGKSITCGAILNVGFALHSRLSKVLIKESKSHAFIVAVSNSTALRDEPELKL